jgi:hypothetical protein
MGTNTTTPCGDVSHYSGHRPHQALQRESPQRQPCQAVDITARIEKNKFWTA